MSVSFSRWVGKHVYVKEKSICADANEKHGTENLFSWISSKSSNKKRMNRINIVNGTYIHFMSETHSWLGIHIGFFFAASIISKQATVGTNGERLIKYDK